MRHVRNGLVMLCLLSLLIGVVAAQEDTETPTETPPTVPSLVGMTAPQAQAALNQAGLLLHPVIETTESSPQSAFRVVDQSPQAGAAVEQAAEVSITIQRDTTTTPNLELRWDVPMRADIPEFDTQLFLIRNLLDDELGAHGFQLALDAQSEALSLVFPGNFFASHCWQVWADATPAGFFRPSDCVELQAEGVLGLGLGETINDAFWLSENSFVVREYGIYRGTCQTADGSCQLWFPPEPIPHDIAPYVYMVYDRQQFVIYNNSPDQWMDLTQLQLTDATLTFADTRTWDTTQLPDTDRLAPGQCVQFVVGSERNPLEDCAVIAVQNTPNSAIFWREGFTILDRLGGETTLTCPAANGRTLCLVQR